MNHLIIEAALAIATARRNAANFRFGATWEEVNEQFRANTSDRRYKVWCCACHDDCSGFWRVGKHEFMIEFAGDNAYVRPMNDDNVYKKLPCWELRYHGNEVYNVRWQKDVLI